mmetsp:Transcript_3821/g.6007  ORF Transcript_3821/g.6007 Transcript_3821/m.6007 type:complete len:80 (-) Transcript_3821:981-1220(-)
MYHRTRILCVLKLLIGSAPPYFSSYVSFAQSRPCNCKATMVMSSTTCSFFSHKEHALFTMAAAAASISGAYLLQKCPIS